jgi:hypothetical protein
MILRAGDHKPCLVPHCGPGQKTYLTKDYTTGWFLSFLGGATHVDVRNPGTGDYWDRIPIDFFPRK